MKLNRKSLLLSFPALILVFTVLISCSDMVSRLKKAKSTEIDVYVSYRDQPIRNLELGHVESVTLSIAFIDKSTGEEIIDYSLIDSIKWFYPDDREYISASTNNNKLNLFLVGGEQTTPPDYSYQVYVSVNGRKSLPVNVSVGDHYTASDEKELEEALRNVMTDPDINTLKIKGDVLVSEPDFFHRIADTLDKKKPDGSGYTVDLSEAETVDLSMDFNVPAGITDIWAYYSNETVEKVILPENLKIIGSNAFFGYEVLTSIKIPDSVVIIEYNAFQGCGLSEITIPASVREIQDYAFTLCEKLQSVVFEGNNITMGKSAFSLCNLTKEKIHFKAGMENVVIDPTAFDGIFKTNP